MADAVKQSRNPFSVAWRWFLRFFLAGVFAVLPLVITVAVVMWVAGIAGQFLGPDAILGEVLEKLGLRFASNDTIAYLIGWVLVLGFILALGVLVEFGARRFMNRWIDALLSRVPLLGGVYGTVRQLVGMMDKKQGSDMKGMSVVFCTFGKETGASFLALLPTSKVFPINGIECHAIIVPTAPVPVGGSMMFVPVTSVRPADITVDAFMSIYVSMGVTAAQFLPCAESSTKGANLKEGEGGTSVAQW
jgi:uncharacterized membrane protein